MTFLDLCQRLRQECGVSGVGPMDTRDQKGEYGRLVDWAQQAWIELQLERPEWKFNWATAEVEVAEGARQITMPDDFSSFERAKLNGETLKVVAWNRVRDPANADKPTRIGQSPGGQWWLDVAPANDALMEIEYWLKPQILEHPYAEPRLPAAFHMLIVYKAMLQYALYENAPEVVEQSRMNESRLKFRLEREQLPPMGLGESLA